jgi:hypothetical protein
MLASRKPKVFCDSSSKVLIHEKITINLLEGISLDETALFDYNVWRVLQKQKRNEEKGYGS